MLIGEVNTPPALKKRQHDVLPIQLISNIMEERFLAIIVRESWIGSVPEKRRCSIFVDG
jgi:hypothetical protein